MRKETSNIVRLIKAIAHPHSMVIFPFIIWDEHFDGIRVIGKGYEFFQITPILEKDRKKYHGAEELESCLDSSVLYLEDEIVIQRILEQILIEMK